jgi:hypothetical protein
MRPALFAVALIVLLGFTTPARAQSDLAGNWLLSFNTPNGMIDADAVFKVDGDKLTGTLSSTAGETKLDGTVKEKTFTFSFEVPTQQGNLTVTISGEQDGDTLKGTFDFGQGTGDWTGKRKASR